MSDIQEEKEGIEVNLTLEEKEDATYSPAKGFFGSTKYAYENPEDFKKLTPEQIVTRRLHIVKPNIESGMMVRQKGILSEPQRQALLRLNAIKSNVERLPKEKQERVRANLIMAYEKQKDNSGQIDSLINQIYAELVKENKTNLDKAIIDADIIRRFKELTKGKNQDVSEEQIIERYNKLIKKGGYHKTSKRKTSKRKTSKRKTSKRKTSKRKTSSIKGRTKTILKRKTNNNKNKKTKRKVVSFNL